MDINRTAINTRCSALEISGSAAAALHPECRGAVAGIYRRCFNLLYPDERLVTVFTARTRLLPGGVRTDLPAEADCRRIGLATGQLAYSAGGNLHIPGAKYVCRLAGAAHRDLRRRGRDLAVEQRQAAGRALAGALISQLPAAASHKASDWVAFLAARGEPPFADPSYGRYFYRHFYDLLLAVKALDDKRATAALQAFAGRGPGLTPAADDMICGLAAWLGLCAASALTTRLFFRILADYCAGPARRQTTESSVFYLACAVRLEFADPVWELLPALIDGDEAVLMAKVRGILAFGASSGADFCLGMLSAALCFSY
ncbi:MAG: DUF2877 domain-containing protein [Gracilibacteraceae bacterium]|jgi:hypothetical protein|nr:DUF2877 domain-containing protein [Gracilibacteraceae bacterium]